MSEQRAGNAEALSLATRKLQAALTNDRVDAVLGAGEEVLPRRLADNVMYLVVARARVYEQEILFNGAGEQLGVLRDEAMTESR